MERRARESPGPPSDASLDANTKRAVSALAALIRGRQPCVVLTGAGISTESGVPDFRSPSGIWARFDPLEYATLDAFHRDPEKVWRFYAPRYSMLLDAEPNAAHLALAELERRGLVRAIVTQNIDLLHTRAGSRDVVEVHGSIRTSTCPRCGETHELARVAELLARDADPAPRCDSCGSVLKPDVVFFGELLPEGAMTRAYEFARTVALMLVIGSSLEVYPVAGLPDETLAAGGELAIVNRGSTAYDARATLAIDAGAGEVLSAVVGEI
jgi:NAD-dependent protein deacetylase/lipoamidase